MCHFLAVPYCSRFCYLLAKYLHGLTALKQNQRHEASGRVIRSILLNKDSRQDRSPSGAQSEREIQTSNQDRDKKPPRPQIVRLFQKDINGAPDHKADGNAIHAVHTEKRERRTRNKDRPDRGVWTPLQRSDGSHASDESLSSYTSQSIPGGDSAEGIVTTEFFMESGRNYSSDLLANFTEMIIFEVPT